MRHLDSDALAAVIAVADLGSFTAAAEHLGKTQAAISMGIARLEDKLGRRLFERTARRVSPTYAGEVLIRYARKIQATEAEALNALMDEQRETRVRLGMPDDFIGTIGDALLHRFGPQNRNIHIDLTCDFSRKLRPLIESGDLDVAVVIQPPETQAGDVLRHEPQVWCTGPTGEPEREACLRLAMFSDQCSARPRIFDILERLDRAWRLAYSSSHLAGIQLAVASGNLLTVLPACAVPAGWRRLGPEQGLPELPPLTLALLMGRRDSLAARKMAAFLRYEFSDQPFAAERSTAMAAIPRG